MHYSYYYCISLFPLPSSIFTLHHTTMVSMPLEFLRECSAQNNKCLTPCIPHPPRMQIRPLVTRRLCGIRISNGIPNWLTDGGVKRTGKVENVSGSPGRTASPPLALLALVGILSIAPLVLDDIFQHKLPSPFFFPNQPVTLGPNHGSRNSPVRRGEPRNTI